jgi:integrase
VAALKQRRQDQDADHQAAGETWEEWGFVLTTRHGSPIDPRNLNRDFTRRVIKAGVPMITVHDARRTCATLLVDLDVHPRVVMQVLRHARFSLTMEIYSKVTSTQTREALKRLGESLDAQP